MVAADSPAQAGQSATQDRRHKLRLGDVLLQQRLISQNQLQQTLDLQRKTGKKMGRLLIEGGLLTEEGLANGLARQLRIPYVNLKTFPFRSELVKLLPESAARRFRALALQGQLAAAAEQAEKARAAGAVSPEVLAYLRQLGVSLR